MATADIAGIYYNDGCVRHSGYVYISGKLKTIDPDEYEYSRMCFYAAAKTPSWGYHDLKWNVSSVCYRSADDSLVALSVRGDVHYAMKSGGTQEKIPDARKLGVVTQVREIGGHLYVCGTQGQVYRRGPRGWIHIDDGILDRNKSADALHLNGIDGTSESDIYVAGYKGRILHFDGVRWTELESPTNVNLERVYCVGPDEAYFCGNKGTLLKLSRGIFTDYSLRTENDFWGMTSFKGKIYLASLDALYVFDGKRVRELDTKLNPPINTYRLDARDGQMWSFGQDDLAFFDGTKWTRVEDPDNA